MLVILSPVISETGPTLLCKVMEEIQHRQVTCQQCLPGVWTLHGLGHGVIILYKLPCGLAHFCLCCCLDLPDGPLATFYLFYMTSTLCFPQTLC